MRNFKTLHDMKAWQASRRLAKEIYQETSSGPVSRDFGYRDQIRRAAISTMANIAEGHGRATPPDKARFFDIARASGIEVEALLYLGLDIGYLDQERFDSLLALSNDAIALTTGMSRYLRTLSSGR